VILAAGDGGRLYPLTSSVPKPLLSLGGRPILGYVLDALSQAGVEDAVIVVGYRGEQIIDAVASIAPPGMRIRCVENEGFVLGNARSVWAAREAVDGPFVMAMADHLVEPELVRALVRGADGACSLAVEHASATDERAEEATLADVREGRVVDLGKGIARWNALDTGVFWCTPRIFDAMSPDMRDGEVSAVFSALARGGELDAADVTGCRWIDIDTAEDLREAEALMTRGAFSRNGHAGVA
jgi:1L-myo-inositol 1-phosphate cytidylyltransferase